MANSLLKESGGNRKYNHDYIQHGFALLQKMARLCVEPYFREALSKTKPRIDQLVKAKQAQPSHWTIFPNYNLLIQYVNYFVFFASSYILHHSYNNLAELLYIWIEGTWTFSFLLRGYAVRKRLRTPGIEG